jgi:SAM-dependent methyltransferase
MTQLAVASSTDKVKLDLACGQRPKEGFKGVDLYAPDTEHVDLLKFPWPWPDSSVDELYCSHFLEHIDARRFEDRDLAQPGAIDLLARFSGRDLLCCFMDEAWRVLKHDGVFNIVVPNARNNRAFQDPTHRRFFVAESFLYFNQEWRKANQLEHYLGNCDFGVEVNHTMLAELGTLHPEAQARRFNESWNVIYDWCARLVCKKPSG